MGCGKTKAYPTDKKQETLSMKIKNTIILKQTRSFTEEYRNGNKIGTGGFAEVRRCTHKITGTMRAVKIYDKTLFTADYLSTGGLIQEIEIFKLLDHPNIVKVYEYFENNNFFYITMEFCLGGELFSKIKAERFTETDVCEVMRQLFSVVCYIHSKSIAHRDLKPENILIEDRGDDLTLKIADFGNAVVMNEGTKMKGETGTCYYMAPEVILGEYTEKCDE